MKPHFLIESDIYGAFKALDRHSYRSIIRFYEQNLHEIQSLPNVQYFELKYQYLSSLFDAGEYYRFLRLVDEAVQHSIEWNLVKFEGKDILISLLFFKAAAWYNLHHIDSARNLLEEILRIDPYNRDAYWFLIRCRIARHHFPIRIARALSIGLLLITSAIIMIELLLLRPFFLSFVQPVEITRNILFIIGFLILVYTEFGLYVRYWASIQKAIRQNIKRKKEKERVTVQ